MFKLTNASITYSSMLQKSTALSTCKAEYMTLTKTSQKAIHLHELLQSLQYTDTSEMPLIYNDNRGSINLTINSKHHKYMKHINVHHHWIHKAINNQHIQIKWISTFKQITDNLMKTLPSLQYTTFRKQLNLLHKILW